MYIPAIPSLECPINAVISLGAEKRNGFMPFLEALLPSEYQLLRFG